MNNFVIGKIINPHGIKGELKVYPTTDDITRFELLEDVIIEGKEYKIENVRYHKENVLLKLESINDMTEAEKYKNKNVEITEEFALPLEEDEYYVRDLIDMKVYDIDTDKLLGILKEVIFTGSNDVYEVHTEDGKKILLPNIKECVIDVNIEEKIMKVKIMEGLL